MRPLHVLTLALIALAVGVVLGWSLKGDDYAPSRTSRAITPPAIDQDSRRTAPEPAGLSSTDNQRVVVENPGGSQPVAPSKAVAVSDAPGTGLSVRVFDERGGVRPGVSVTVTVGTQVATGSTDGAGVVEFPRLKAGQAAVTVSSGTAVRTFSGLAVVEGRMTEVTVTLAEGVRVSGVVRHTIRGLLAGVQLRMIRHADDSMHVTFTVRTDHGGAYALEGVPPGAYRVELSGSPMKSTVITRIEVPDTVTRMVHDFTVGSTLVEGAVFDRNTRAALIGADVRFYPAAERVAVPVAESTSGPRGEWAVEDLPVGSYRIVVQIDGYSRAVLSDVQLTDIPVRLEVPLDAATTLRLLVFDAAGQPVVGAVLATVQSIGGGDAIAFTEEMKASREGEILCRRLSPGKYRIALRRGSAWGAVDVELGTDEATVRVRLAE